MKKALILLAFFSTCSCGNHNEPIGTPAIRKPQPEEGGTYWNIEQDKWISQSTKFKKIELMVRARSDGIVEVAVINRDETPIYVPPITPYNYWIGGFNSRGKELGSIPRGTPPFVLESDLVKLENGKILSALIRPDANFIKGAVKVFAQPSYFIEEGETKTAIKGLRSGVVDTSKVWHSLR